MKVAILADAHANFPALEAVLKDIKRQNAEEIWYLGDSLGYGPYPQKVMELIKRSTDECIAGNYDLNILKFPSKKKEWKDTKDPAKYFSFSWTYQHLSAKMRQYIRSLPRSKALVRQGKKYLLVHGSPAAIDDPLQKDTPDEKFFRIARDVKADVVLCGHTHEFFDKTIGGVRFVNPGSVGRPFNGDPRASYAVFDIRDGKEEIVNRKVSYRIGKVLKKMKEEKFPPAVIRSIKEGKSLDAVKAEQAKKRTEEQLIDEVVKLARSCAYERAHSHHVTKLALKLFDELKELHQLDARHRIWLQSASLLHDIGWVKGRVRHHKTARDIILKSFDLPLTAEERVMVALVARYHRKTLPKNTHKYYCDLKPERQVELKKLAAILRIADGLDRSHVSAVKDIACEVLPQSTIVRITNGELLEWEEAVTLKKSDLFREVYKKNIKIQRA